MSPSYWVWFLRGTGGRAGWRRLADGWLLAHLAVGGVLSFLVTVKHADAAQSVLLPLAGVFIGMSFAWVGNAQALVQSDEIEQLARASEDGYETYVYTFQTAVLVMLVTLAGWGLAGLEVFEGPCLITCPSWAYKAAGVMLYGAASLTIRECWHVVLGAQLLLLAQRAIRRIRKTPDAT